MQETTQSDQNFVLSRHADAKCVKSDTLGMCFVFDEGMSKGMAIGNGPDEDAAWHDAAEQIRRWEEIIRDKDYQGQV